MKFSAISILLLFIVFCGFSFGQSWMRMMPDTSANFYEIQKGFNKYWIGKKIVKGKGWRQYKRWENFMAPRVYPSGNLNHSADLWKVSHYYKSKYASKETTTVFVSSVAVSHNDPEVIWVFLSGYSAGDTVYSSRDGGLSWTNYSGTIPNIPANIIIMESGSDEGLYVGTDLGVYYRDSAMTQWITYNKGLPHVVIDELEIHYGSGKLRAAIYGRGLWEVNLYSPLGTGNDFSSEHNKMKIFPNPGNGIINIDFDGDHKKMKPSALGYLTAQVAWCMIRKPLYLVIAV